MYLTTSWNNKGVSCCSRVGEGWCFSERFGSQSWYSNSPNGTSGNSLVGGCYSDIEF